MKELKSEQFIIDKKVKLKNLTTHEDFGLSEEALENKLAEVRVKLAKLQDTMYAHGKYAVLVCLQGMDTAGKDSMITFGGIILPCPQEGSLGYLIEPTTKMYWSHGYIPNIF